MKHILTALLVGFVAMASMTAIAAPVTGTEERAVGNIAFTPLSDELSWVKYTKVSDDLVTSWHVYGLVPETVYDLQFVYTAEDGTIATETIADDVVAEVTAFDDGTTSTYGSINEENLVYYMPDGAYEGTFSVVGADGSIVSATSSFTLY